MSFALNSLLQTADSISFSELWGSDEPLKKAVTRVSQPFNEQQNQEYLTFRQLRNRGWSKRMVERFLESADALTENPHLSSGRPMRLYSAGRVDMAEIRDDFKACIAAAKIKSDRSNAIHVAKSEALLDLAQSIEVKIPALSRENLALWSQQEYGPYIHQEDRHKNEVAYLVANTKDAEWGLDAFYWHQGIRNARLCLRRRVLVEIMNAYPHLSDAVLEISRLEAGVTE